MKNDLIFNNGTVFPICPTEAANAPRMMGGGWRQWRVEAACADAVTALEAGVSRREYESIVGSDEQGQPIVEVLTEDLAAYVVGGSVCDHRDGTCTLWARRETDLEIAQRKNAEYAENLAALGVAVD